MRPISSKVILAKERARRKKAREEMRAAFFVFISATFWLWFDVRGLFGGNVVKNPAGYIFIADEKPTMYERHKSTAY